jgi:crotonobetainyl-CoA:carnitine CoA-transferase CaiB-like acyl-CoA transferase
LNPLPLLGLKVLDFGQGVAGPYCAQLLADQGAEVVKVEPIRGDWSRTMGVEGGVFSSVNRNKRGICLDLRDAEALAIARALARTADVVVESFRPGVMKKMTLGSAELRSENPGLVYCSVTGFGADGPNADLPAGDSTMQAYGGLMSVIGERDGNPLRVGNVVSDMLAGMNAFSGVLLALMARTQGAGGQDISVSLLDSIVAFQAPTLSEYLLTGQKPTRMGNDHPLIAPSGTVQTLDGAITFTVFDHQWARFCTDIGSPDLAVDSRFCTPIGRQRNRDSLSHALAPAFAAKSRVEWIATLRAMDILCAPVNEYPDLQRDPQVLHNELLGSIADSRGAQKPNIANPIRMSSGTRLPTAAPQLGEHTRAVLTEFCRCSVNQLDAMQARGAIGST